MASPDGTGSKVRSEPLTRSSWVQSASSASRSSPTRAGPSALDAPPFEPWSFRSAWQASSGWSGLPSTLVTAAFTISPPGRRSSTTGETAPRSFLPRSARGSQTEAWSELDVAPAGLGLGGDRRELYCGAFSGKRELKRSASAVIVRAGLTPTFAGIADASHT